MDVGLEGLLRLTSEDKCELVPTSDIDLLIKEMLADGCQIERRKTRGVYCDYEWIRIFRS